MTELFFLHVHWSPDPVAFDLLGREVRWYGVLFALGFVFGLFLLTPIFKKENLEEKYLNYLVYLVALGAVAGARFGEVVFYQPDYYLAHPEEILQIWKGGLASHGAVIGIALAVWFFSKKLLSKPFLWVADRVVASIAIAAACVRLGNLMNSEIIGKATSLPWAFVFESVDQLPRHPSQLYEAGAYILLGAALTLLYHKKSWGDYKGKLAGLFFTGMFTCRFLIEFAKERQEDFEALLPLSMGQLLSLPLIAIGLWLLLKSRPDQKTANAAA